MNNARLPLLVAVNNMHSPKKKFSPTQSVSLNSRAREREKRREEKTVSLSRKKNECARVLTRLFSVVVFSLSLFLSLFLLWVLSLFVCLFARGERPKQQREKERENKKMEQKSSADEREREREMISNEPKSTRKSKNLLES